jgi:hypothetical protein
MGMSNYQGDLVKHYYTVAESNPGGEIAYHNFFSRFFSYSASLSYLHLSADDRKYGIKNAPQRYIRAIKMDNVLIEFGGDLRFHPFLNRASFNSRVKPINFQPYVGLGAVLPINFHRVVDQNLDDGLENYDAEQFFLGLSGVIGYQVFFNHKIGVGLELKSRMVFSDTALDGYTHKKDNIDLYHLLSAQFLINLDE